MKKVSVFYIATGSYWLSRHSFESIGFALKPEEMEIIFENIPRGTIKTIGDTEVELFVADHTNDSRTTEYFSALADNVSSYPGQSLASVCNEMFRKSSSEYICIITSGTFLQKNWLYDLMYYCDAIKKSGIVGIMSNVNKSEYIPMLNDEGDFMDVFIPKSCLVSGLYFFRRERLYTVGAMDESVNLTDNEINQFALRCVAYGYYNYCIPTQTMVISNEGNYISEEDHLESYSNMVNTLSEMKKNRNYYIPLDSIGQKSIPA